MDLPLWAQGTRSLSLKVKGYLSQQISSQKTFLVTLFFIIIIILIKTILINSYFLTCQSLSKYFFTSLLWELQFHVVVCSKFDQQFAAFFPLLKHLFVTSLNVSQQGIFQWLKIEMIWEQCWTMFCISRSKPHPHSILYGYQCFKNNFFFWWVMLWIHLMSLILLSWKC